MTAYLEVRRDTSNPDLVVLDLDSINIGRALSNDITVPEDELMSRRHAILEYRAGGWLIRDLGSRNGTFLNEERIVGQRALHDRDEIRVGVTRMVYRQAAAGDREQETRAAQHPPDLTRRERDVLLALFQAGNSAEVFSEPATIKEMARVLYVSEAAIKQHLMHLFDKFEIPAGIDRRRLRLANEALRRGAVRLSEIRRTTT